MVVLRTVPNTLGQRVLLPDSVFVYRPQRTSSETFSFFVVGVVPHLLEGCPGNFGELKVIGDKQIINVCDL